MPVVCEKLAHSFPPAHALKGGQRVSHDAAAAFIYYLDCRALVHGEFGRLPGEANFHQELEAIEAVQPAADVLLRPGVWAKATVNEGEPRAAARIFQRPGDHGW